jgi:hypothetical protein
MLEAHRFDTIEDNQSLIYGSLFFLAFGLFILSYFEKKNLQSKQKTVAIEIRPYQSKR